MLHESKLSYIYSTVNTARSMLSFVLELNINSSLPAGQLPIVKRFMKGIYELRPSLPRYTATWDFRTFAPIVSAHPYCARESHATSCHVMHRARALSTKMNK